MNKKCESIIFETLTRENSGQVLDKTGMTVLRQILVEYFQFFNMYEYAVRK